MEWQVGDDPYGGLLMHVALKLSALLVFDSSDFFLHLSGLAYDPDIDHGLGLGHDPFLFLSVFEWGASFFGLQSSSPLDLSFLLLCPCPWRPKQRAQQRSCHRTREFQQMSSLS